MTVLIGKHIRAQKGHGGDCIIEPYVMRTQHEETSMSYGESVCGYDVRVEQALKLEPLDFVLASTYERFDMPTTLVGMVHDKSTLARRGIAVQNTVIEPGWCGWLTLEITNHGHETVILPALSPIAQIVFHQLSGYATPYSGKYQDQERGPQGPR